MNARRLRSAALAALAVCAACATPRPNRPAPAPARGSAPSLLTTDSLAAWQAAGRPLRLVDVRTDVFTYLEGHLPEAVYLHIETIRAADRGLPTQLLSPEQYRALFSRLGITFEQPVVIYSAGETHNIDATFLAWILAGFGHPRVYLLDGGYFKWQLEHRPIARRYPRFEPSRFPEAAFAPEMATLEETERAMRTGDALLVDARPPDQFAGEAGAQMRRGHIPGAINHYWQDDLEQVGFGRVWKRPDQLRAAYAAQGITPDRAIIAYCNSITEASHVFFALRYLLGYPDVRIYTGSWTEWAERGELPVERGRSGRSGRSGR